MADFGEWQNCEFRAREGETPHLLLRANRDD
jgi:hypothetical protein